MNLEQVAKLIRNVPDFPQPGIQFKDITTAIKNPEAFSFLVDYITKMYTNKGITKVVGVESRGFILGGAVAAYLGAGFVPVRKPGKLPAESDSIEYSLEYGTGKLEIHKDAIESNDIVLVHDDLLATGGTAKAAIDLVCINKPAKVYGNFVVELDFLNGRNVLEDFNVTTLIHF